VIFVEVIILMGIVLIRIILHKKMPIIWAIQEGKEGFQIIIKIICLIDGWTIRIRALDHLAGNLIFNSNNKFLQLKTGPQ